MNDKSKTTAKISKATAKSIDTILADCLEVRHGARKMRKELEDGTKDDPFARLFGAFGLFLLCGMQLGATLCILSIKRRRAGRTDRKSFLERIVRMAGMGKRMENAGKEA